MLVWYGLDGLGYRDQKEVFPTSCPIYKGLNTWEVITHGQTKTKEYRTWNNMKRRCLNPNDHNYQKYGGRGITVCKNWEDSFEEFFKDMGYAPTPQHTIDRINNNGIYEATNYRWATQKEQNRNYSRNINITINDETHCLKEWCEIYNKPYDLVYQRITKLGWNPATAIRL